MPITFEAPNYQIGNSGSITSSLSSVLTTLDQALQALQPAPNANTVQFNDTIIVSATAGEQAILLPSGLIFNTLANPTIISNTGGYDLTVQSSSQLILNSNDNVNINAGVGLLVNASDYISMTANNDSISFTADDNISLVSAGLGDINLNAPNINSYGYALPICFTRERHDIFSYNLGSQQMENVYIMDIAVPPKFFVDNPQSGYTSNIWKIDFALNCYDCSFIGDKGLALYIEFQDQNTTVYTPNTYNLDTPYAVWQNPSTYNGVSHLNFQNFNWSDFVDLSPLVNTGSGNLPLRVFLYFAGDIPFNAKFIQTITLTRTNQV